jgi:hypothetical protein
MLPDPLHSVAETAAFIRDAEAAGMSEEEREALVASIAANPLQGVEIRGSGIRKVRVAGRSQGKRGGFRVIVSYLGEDVPVYLIALLSKGERANFTSTEIARMKTAVEYIRLTWSRRRRRK